MKKKLLNSTHFELKLTLANTPVSSANLQKITLQFDIKNYMSSIVKVDCKPDQLPSSQTRISNTDRGVISAGLHNPFPFHSGFNTGCQTK